MVITEDVFCFILGMFCSWNLFLHGFTVSSYQRPFRWQNCGYSTVIDGILAGIFLIVHTTFLVSCFKGCWLLNFFLCSKYRTYNGTAIELVAADFTIKRLQQHGHEFRDQTNLLAKETLKSSAIFLFVFYLDSR